MNTNVLNVNDSSVPVDAKAMVGKAVSVARSTIGMSQTQLSKKSNLTQPAIARLEKGKINTDVKTLIKLANAMDASFQVSLIDKDNANRFSASLECIDEVNAMFNAFLKSKSISKRAFVRRFGSKLPACFTKQSKKDGSFRVDIFSHMANSFDVVFETALVLKVNKKILSFLSSSDCQDVLTPKKQRTDEAALIGRKIKEIRKEKGLTQFELASNTGIGKMTISFIESGKCEPLLPTLVHILQGLDSVLQLTFTPKDGIAPIQIVVESPDSAQQISRTIKELRLKKLLTLNQLSAKINSGVSSISIIERAVHLPSLPLLRKLAQGLDVDLSVDIVNYS